MNIVTLTWSPAFDIHCHTGVFLPHQENLVRITSCDAGGKGVNISRALKANGVESTALVALGEENAPLFRQKLAEYGLSVQELTYPGRIRENITLHENGAPETRISFPGPSATLGLISDTEKALASLLTKGDVLTLTGRIPDGLVKAAVTFLCRLQKRGIRLVIDSRSLNKEQLFSTHPFLIKPNEEEIAAYTGYQISSPKQGAVAAEALQAQGIEHVMISLGEKGAVLACAFGTYHCAPPPITVRSTVGAGDSSIAGFLAAKAKGLPDHECLATAVAYGSAACMTDGTRPPLPEDVESIRSRLILTKYKQKFTL